ncbi:MAG TPA: single-stranded DNA-binding protein [Puia sp.]|nr:single-stranded DNA-binding protein [Puia sp.]
MRQNRVQLIGYVGDSPKIKMLDNGTKRATLKVATHYRRRRDNMRSASGTDWHWVIAWGSDAEFAERSFVRGSHILVEGSIIYREYADYTGSVRKITDIRAEELINLDR